MTVQLEKDWQICLVSKRFQVKASSLYKRTWLAGPGLQNYTGLLGKLSYRQDRSENVWTQCRMPHLVKTKLSIWAQTPHTNGQACWWRGDDSGLFWRCRTWTPCSHWVDHKTVKIGSYNKTKILSTKANWHWKSVLSFPHTAFFFLISFCWINNDIMYYEDTLSSLHRSYKVHNE